MVGEKISVVIPSYNPNENLRITVENLRSSGFNDIIIVNDGSDESHLRYFPDKYEPCCTIINLSENRGKGYALKTGFRYFLSHRKNRVGVVTVDGDGLHTTEEIISCCEELLKQKEDCLILGTRDFSNRSVSFSKRLMNRFNSAIFRSVTHQYISDTRTTLRAIPTAYLRDCSRIPGQRYEYELNVLLKMPEFHMKAKEVKVNANYIKKHRLSNFHPIRDSFLIGVTILKFMASSLFCTGVDLLAFFLLSKYLGVFFSFASITLCTFLARALSSFLNYNINKTTVFSGNDSQKYSLLKFYTVAIPQACLSALFLQLLSSIFAVKFAWVRTLLKMCVDTSLFFISFKFQRKWVFSNKSKKDTV